MTTATAIKRDFSREITKDISVLGLFTETYCKANHGDAPRKRFVSERYFPKGGPTLCEDCAKLLGYAVGKRVICPMDPKPACRKCPNHCYRPEQREQMQDVMRFSGPYLIKRGRFGLLLHFLK